MANLLRFISHWRQVTAPAGRRGRESQTASRPRKGFEFRALAVKQPGSRRQFLRFSGATSREILGFAGHSSAESVQFCALRKPLWGYLLQTPPGMPIFAESAAQKCAGHHRCDGPLLRGGVFNRAIVLIGIPIPRRSLHPYRHPSALQSYPTPGAFPHPKSPPHSSHEKLPASHRVHQGV